LKVIEAFKCLNQSIVYFVIAIHGNWIPAVPAGMTTLGLDSNIIKLSGA
jgi:hypothetical protein